MIKEVVDEGLCGSRTFHINNNGRRISHLFFADDVLLFAKANPSQVRLSPVFFIYSVRSLALRVMWINRRYLCLKVKETKDL